ncbi:carboxypeptidase-like regulatory domain-containing protein [Rubripirellula amarantea]|nr:carboxypeptidase-like regulatory domain-containing protein [Rubripirellula amarantea]
METRTQFLINSREHQSISGRNWGVWGLALLVWLGGNGVKTRAAGMVSVHGVVTDESGEPVSDATVVAIQKTWPRGRFQMNSLSTRTNEKGAFRFDDFATRGQPYEFLLTAMPDRHCMVSEYRSVRNGKSQPAVKLRVTPSEPTRITLTDTKGVSLPHAKVIPLTRITADGSEHMTYPIEMKDVGITANHSGVAELHAFLPGEKGKLMVEYHGNISEHAINIPSDQRLEIAIEAVEGRVMEGATNKDVVDSNAPSLGRVVSSSGQPIAGANVLLVLKTWPDGRFRQQVLHTESGRDGNFALSKMPGRADKKALLVTILKQGYEMTSEYRTFGKGEAIDSFEFTLENALPAKFRFVDKHGESLGKTRVFIARRKTPDKEHMIYAQSGADATFTTDDLGNIDLAFFQVGDVVRFIVQVDGKPIEATATITAEPTQRVVVSES